MMICRDDVKLSVTVKVRSREKERPARHREILVPAKLSAFIAVKNRDTVSGIVGGDQIAAAVTIKVGCLNRAGGGFYFGTRRGGKVSLTIAHQHGKVELLRIHGGEIELTVSIEITRGYCG